MTAREARLVGHASLTTTLLAVRLRQIALSMHAPTIEISQNLGDTTQLLHTVQERQLGSAADGRALTLMRVACVNAPNV